MKTLFALTIFLFSLTLWALDNASSSSYEGRSWEDIEADNSLLVTWPTVMGMPINKVCLTKDKIKSLVPLRSCKEWRVTNARDCRKKTDWCYTSEEMSYGEGQLPRMIYHKCAQPEVKKEVQVSRYVAVNSCLESKAVYEGSSTNDIDNHSCTKFKREKKLFPQVHSVSIANYSGQNTTWENKNYTIPLCNM